MAKIIIYIAQSLDGKIARENGSVDWLADFDAEDYGYPQFLSAIGVVLMGNKTYQQVLTFGGEFPYKDKKVFVFTKDKSLTKDENVTFISENIAKFVANLKKSSQSNIWLVGGGEIITYLLDKQLVDDLQVFTIPIILKSGIGLCNTLIDDIKLRLINNKTFKNGVVENYYKILYNSNH